MTPMVSGAAWAAGLPSQKAHWTSASTRNRRGKQKRGSEAPVGASSHCPRITNDELPLLPPREERESAGMRPAAVAPEGGRTNGFNRSFTPSFFVNGCGKFSPGAKSLECGDLSPLLPLWRLV